ncbi:adaptor protein MecA, partial [Staphylococcus epidermidis]|uniref:adaptor protein MecA n=1 Tax=Staphylococcus epidermidis TaxID=1282 RepID=UPI0034D95504
VLQRPLSIQLHPFQNPLQVTISKSKNQDPINISDDHTNHQFHHHLNELFPQTLEAQQTLQHLFQQPKQQNKNHQHKQQTPPHNPSNLTN